MARPTVEEVINWLDQQALSAQRNAHRYCVGSDFWKLCMAEMQMHAEASQMLASYYFKEKANALEEGKVPQDGIGQHPRGGEGRKAAEAGSGDRPVKGRKKPWQKEKAQLEHSATCECAECWESMNR